MIHCIICTTEVSSERQKRKGYSAVACSDECYAEFRKIKKRPARGRRVEREDYALVQRIRRAKARGQAEITLQLV